MTQNKEIFHGHVLQSHYGNPWEKLCLSNIFMIHIFRPHPLFTRGLPWSLHVNVYHQLTVWWDLLTLEERSVRHLSTFQLLFKIDQCFFEMHIQYYFPRPLLTGPCWSSLTDHPECVCIGKSTQTGGMRLFQPPTWSYFIPKFEKRT